MTRIQRSESSQNDFYAAPLKQTKLTPKDLPLPMKPSLPQESGDTAKMQDLLTHSFRPIPSKNSSLQTLARTKFFDAFDKIRKEYDKRA